MLVMSYGSPCFQNLGRDGFAPIVWRVTSLPFDSPSLRLFWYEELCGFVPQKRVVKKGRIIVAWPIMIATRSSRHDQMAASSPLCSCNSQLQSNKLNMRRVVPTSTTKCTRSIAATMVNMPAPKSTINPTFRIIDTLRGIMICIQVSIDDLTMGKTPYRYRY